MGTKLSHIQKTRNSKNSGTVTSTKLHKTATCDTYNYATLVGEMKQKAPVKICCKANCTARKTAKVNGSLKTHT